jgi:hypothetical protein
MRLRYKIIIGLLALGLVVSLGLNIYIYLAFAEKQKTVNNIRGELVAEWANEMDVAAHYLKNITTNIDVAEQYGVRWFLLSAYRIMRTAYEQGDHPEFYEPLANAPLDAAGNLIPYEEGAQTPPIVEQHISPLAIEMFGNLSDRISNVTNMIFQEAITLVNSNGVDPVQKLQEKGILNDVIQGCLDISLYSYQIHEFTPKFQ